MNGLLRSPDLFLLGSDQGGLFVFFTKNDFIIGSNNPTGKIVAWICQAFWFQTSSETIDNSGDVDVLGTLERT